MLSLALKFLMIAVAAGGVFLSKKYFHAKDDNVIEELVEMEIKEESGLDVDLSPETPENEFPISDSDNSKK